ncbi:MAG: DNA polymerase I [Planctomycetes bacterium]|nr:DNA polymerase I [Planctomycetota bacterium]
MKRLLVIDGTALAFRAFFAIRGLTDDQGRPSGALYGYIMSVLRAIEDHPAEYLAVAWDRPEPTFRHELSKTYKANREELDQDLEMQFPWMREVTELLGIPSLDRVGYEADDILASLAVQAEAAGIETRIFSSDKDLAQVVSERVLQCPPPKQSEPAKVMGPGEIVEKFGVEPRQMIDWQAMVGDSSDNIPGVPGVGPKRATTLLQKYGDLETVLARGPKEEKGKLAENLAAHADDARAAQQLVRMVTDLDLGPVTQLVQNPRQPAALLAFCEAHGFRSLAERFEAETNVSTAECGAASPVEERDYRTIDRPELLAELRAGLEASGGFAFDTETTDIDPMRARLVGMSFCWQARTAWYVPMNLADSLRGPDGEDPVDYLAPVLANPRIPKLGQNLKYDVHVMRRAGAPLQGIDFDTMSAHFLLHPEDRHNLDELSLKYLGLRKIPTKELLGTGKNALTMDLVPIPAVSEYACEDADATWQLGQKLKEELGESRDADQQILTDLELPLLPVLERMEAHGIALDKKILRNLDRNLEKRQAKLEKIVHDEAGEPFNLNSPKQLGPILFEKLVIQDIVGVKRVGKTKTGYKTDAATLERYSGVPIVNALMEYRQITKLRGTYLEALPRYVHPETGRIHTSFNQAVAATGRLSSSDPNLQNIPIRTEAGREIRRAFIAPKDHSILAADYSQIELRLVAHMSQDPALIQAFRDGADVHARTAALVFADGNTEDVTPEMRSRAKAINFGILYGMGPQRLARDLDISFTDARTFIDSYFKALPGVRAWIDQTLVTATEVGAVYTLFGRRRRVPDLASQDGRVRSNAENIAVNSPVQGSAADLIKMAMIAVDQRLQDEGLTAKMLLQVHDELVFECPNAELEQLQVLVREEMEGVCELSVPLHVDIGTGPNWASAH